MVIRAGIYNMLVRITNSEDTDQTASDLGLHCLSRPFGMQLVFEILDHLQHIVLENREYS